MDNNIETSICDVAAGCLPITQHANEHSTLAGFLSITENCTHCTNKFLYTNEKRTAAAVSPLLRDVVHLMRMMQYGQQEEGITALDKSRECNKTSCTMDWACRAACLTFYVRLQALLQQASLLTLVVVHQVVKQQNCGPRQWEACSHACTSHTSKGSCQCRADRGEATYRQTLEAAVITHRRLLS